MSKSKKAKKNVPASSIDKNKYNMKVVLSDVCAKCRKCERGVRYLEKMSVPGAVGNGVPCILTRGKAYV
ncbi:hypothetical protein SAMN02799630_02564 [Paenibacillus sp. UNCCL117]|uniref:hypothetical protein n=1 Tax=unclassified Paenibacillus TaxID=185978 RepID=UPI000885A5C6|nr:MULTISPECIES: hypothetical protein [unclassified Paenibacillus]SDC06068.1 hypothetical protein SAMN04488602_101233 [Paenibacillus sp. cl123]SFW37722.1 hypothetical protein SAMN02799630_02564 [Paenibacillus sp. UNCCL117]